MKTTESSDPTPPPPPYEKNEISRLIYRISTDKRSDKIFDFKEGPYSRGGRGGGLLN